MSEYIVDFSTSTYKSNDGLIFASVEQLREEIIRCEECRYYSEDDYDICIFWDESVEPDWFCSNGARRKFVVINE